MLKLRLPRSRRAWLLGLLAVVWVAGAAWGFWPRDPGPICPDSFQRLELGMTQAEIEGVLGLLPGDYYTGPRQIGRLPGPFINRIQQKGERPSYDDCAKWMGDYYFIGVAFDGDGKAVWYCLAEVGTGFRFDFFGSMRYM